jgi:chemotaxis protein CheX
MISGKALHAMSDAGHICDLAPPTVIRGNSVQITTANVPAIVIPLSVSHGTVSLTVSLSGKAMSKAA